MGDGLVGEINEAVEYLTRRFSRSGIDVKPLEDVKSLNEMLQEIRAMLDDAEEMEITSESTSLCLRKLKKSFYDVEDVLDEFLYHWLHLKSVDDNLVLGDPGVVDQERDPGSSTNPHGSLACMDDLVQKTGDLKVRVGKTMKDWGAHAKRLKKRCQQRTSTVRVQSTSLMGSTPIGRDDALKEIKRLLFSELNGDGNIPVIAIVGMGGLGKTALAQSVFNAIQVPEEFDQRIWVCVTVEFDLRRLTKAMLEYLEKKPCDLKEMDSLQSRLKDIVTEKKILLVLDDIWEHQNLDVTAWEDLCRPLSGVKDGSKIIVTTREQKILYQAIKPAEVHQLRHLTNDDCFTLFSQRAFKHGTSGINLALLDIGKKISNKCGGLPLAAKTLGSLLRGQYDVEVWNGVLKNSGTWGSAEQNSIMPILGLSYQYLPTKLKKCFRYLSVFPKGFRFFKEELVSLWIAHGYIIGRERGKKQPEDIGEEYINELVSRCLLEQCEDFEKIKRFRMHDLIHDLARDVSQGEWSSVEDGIFYGSQDGSVLHLSVISTENYPQECARWQHKIRCLVFFNSSLLKWSYINDFCSGMKWLRVLHLGDCLNGLELLDCISDLKHLRYLTFENIDIPELPESVGSLHLLESLCLAHSMIQILPDSIGFLKCLRYLGLHYTRIKDLPESLGMLDQLHTLDLREKDPHYHLPNSIGKLSSLRQLFCNDDLVLPSEIRKLTNLNVLDYNDNGRHVSVKEFTDLVNVDEAKKASSYNKERLKVLSLVWNDNPSPLAHHLHGEVLETLGRHPNLRQLYMQGFGGCSLPSWLTDPHYLPQLIRIDLVRCEQLTSLLPLENFPKLRHLHIELANRLQDMSSSSVDSFKNLRVLEIIRCSQLQFPHLGGLPYLKHLSIIGSHQDIPIDFSSGGFPALESLKLEDLPNWTSWAGPKKDQCHKLQKLSVVGCNSLEKLSISYLSLVDVKDCPVLKISRYANKKLQDMEKYYGTNIEKIKIISDGYDVLDAMDESQRLPIDIRLWNLIDVEHLVISDCKMLESISSEELPSSLKSIQVDACWNMRDLQLGNQHALKYLCIENCQQLSQVQWISSKLRFLKIHSSCKKIFCPLGNLSHVEYLSVENCEFPFSCVPQLPMALKRVGIFKCSHLPFFPLHLLQSLDELIIRECYWNATIRDVKWLPSTLKKLKIIECSDLTYFPLHFLESLDELVIDECSWPARFQDVKQLSSTVKMLKIWRCSDLTFFPLHFLENLDTLRISECSWLATFQDVKWLPSKLKKLVIEKCSDLTFFPLYFLENLDELVIYECSWLATFRDVKWLPSKLKKLQIRKCSDLTFFPLHFLENLDKLVIYECSWPTTFQDVKWLPSIVKSLQIWKCSDLTFFPLHFLENLDELMIVECSWNATIRDVKWLPSTLKKLVIEKCSDLTFFPLHFLENLDELVILECSWNATIRDVKWLPSTLKKLVIEKCSDLTFFPLHFLENLDEVVIYECSWLATFRDVKWLSSKLKNLQIEKCSDLTFFPLHFLENLDKLVIVECSWPAKFQDVKWLLSTVKKL